MAESNIHRLQQLLESFQMKQKACINLQTSIDQVDVNIQIDSQKLDEIKRKVYALKEKQHGSRQNQELLLETERVLIKELDNERSKQIELNRELLATEEDASKSKSHLKNLEDEYICLLDELNNLYLSERATKSQVLLQMNLK